MKTIILYIFLIIFFHSHAIAEKEKITLDSLKSLLKSPIDSVKINALIDIFNYYSNSHPQIALKYADQALAYSRKTGNKSKQAEILNSIGIINIDLGNFKMAKSYFEDAMYLAMELKNLDLLARTYGNLGNALTELEDYDNALKCYKKTLTYYEKHNDKNGLAILYGTLGNLYFNLINLEKAFENYSKAKEYFLQINKEFGIALCDMNLGIILKEKKEYKKALEYLFKAKSVFEKINYSLNFTQCLSCIGNCYSKMKEYDKALFFLKAALDIFQAENSADGLSKIYCDIAIVFISKKKYNEALIYLKKSLVISKEIEYPSQASNAIEQICIAYDSLKDYKNAYLFKNEHLKYIEEINNIETTNKREQLLAEFETKQKELLIDKKEAEIQKQRWYMLSLITAISFVFIILIILINRFKLKQKVNKSLELKNTQITQQHDEISKQRDKIELQKIEIEKQHKEVLSQKKDITDSIIYAKRIQTALLSDNEKVNYVLKNGFCLFRPRDIVSGDFYWVTQIEELSIIIAADCTGHGVPGAFMSIVGMNFLNEIIIGKKILNAAEILDTLRQMVVDALSHTADLSETKDGMDIALCVLNRKNNIMQFAGAYNPVWIVKKVESCKVESYKVESEKNIENNFTNFELYELKADKMPIGYSDKMDISFTSNEIKLNNGDSVYLFSDGYVDQFGGADYANGGKKFRAKKLKELLLNINHKPMINQKEILEKTFEEWRGSLDQIDDLLIIGFKI